MQTVLLCIENITAKESKLLTKQATLETKELKIVPCIWIGTSLMHMLLKTIT